MIRNEHRKSIDLRTGILLACAGILISFLPFWGNKYLGLYGILVRNLVILLVTVPALFFASRPNSDAAWPVSFGQRRLQSGGQTVMMLVLVFFGFRASAMLGNLVGKVVTTEQILPGGKDHTFILILTVVISAPLMEEVLIRGLLFRGLREKTPFFLAAVISSAVWGTWHLNFSQAISAFGIGMIMALIYELYRNLWVTIGLHMLNNGLAMYVLNHAAPFEANLQPKSEDYVVLLTEILISVFLYYKLIKGEPLRGRFSRR